MKIFYGIAIMGAMVKSVFYFYEMKIVRRILEPMIEERPFDDSVVKNIRFLSWVILIGEGIWSVIAYVVEVFEYYAFDFQNLFLSDKVVAVNAEFTFNTSFIGMFLVIYFLSYVFQYGQELQIQSDETL